MLMCIRLDSLLNVRIFPERLETPFDLDADLSITLSIMVNLTGGWFIRLTSTKPCHYNSMKSVTIMQSITTKFNDQCVIHEPLKSFMQVNLLYGSNPHSIADSPPQRSINSAGPWNDQSLTTARLGPT